MERWRLTHWRIKGTQKPGRTTSRAEGRDEGDGRPSESQKAPGCARPFILGEGGRRSGNDAASQKQKPDVDVVVEGVLHCIWASTTH